MTPRFWISLMAGVFVLGCGIGLLLPRPQRERSFEELEVNDLVDNYFRTHPRDFDTSFKKVCKPKEIEAPHWDTVYFQIDDNHSAMTISIMSDSGVVIFGPYRVTQDTVTIKW